MPSPPSPPSRSPPRPRASADASSGRDTPTPSQLDIIAERNERIAGRGRFRRSAVPIAVASAVVLLGAAMLWLTQRAVPRAPGAAPVVGTTPTVPTPTVPAVAADAVASTEAAAAIVPAASQVVTDTAAPAAADRARKARTRREAELRAAALPASSQRQPREDDTAREVAADARPSGAEAATSGVQTSPEPRPARTVRDLCATRGNIVSELLCRTRECRKLEHAKDATCVNLREIEEAQRRVDPQ